MINYMDRQTLANLAVRITDAFQLTKEQYGNLEFAFGWAFAAGSLLFGFLVDRVSVRWLYPAVLLGWSAAGALTGLARTYEELLACRTLLGLFEAGHWPCALVTTQRLLSRESRTLGNSILQSGASLGAVLTPPLVLWCLRWSNPDDPLAWRFPFVAVGAVGTVWVVIWLAVIRRGDLDAPAPASPDSTRAAVWWLLLDRRFLVLLVVVACINSTWQLVRAWLPMFLQKGRGYSESDALYFNSVYYIATDVGCLAAGAATLWLTRRGVAVHGSRLIVFAGCAALTALTTAVSVTSAGPLLLGLLLLVAAGSLGLFPCYYSFTQELSARHMGKVTGLLGAWAWFVSSPLQKLFGRVVDQTGSYDTGIGIVGWPPLLALVVMLLLWRRSEPTAEMSR
jgi:MFS family permease